jgi:hypothetical protein
MENSHRQQIHNGQLDSINQDPDNQHGRHGNDFSALLVISAVI